MRARTGIAPGRLWIFAGPNGAGKSTLVQRYVAGRLPVINPDDIAARIAPERRNDLDVTLKAGREALRLRAACLNSGRSFVVETTLTGRTEIALIRQAREQGYRVSVVFVALRSPVLSLGRVTERVRRGGHTVSSADIHRRFPRSLANLALAVALADRTLVIDNSGQNRRFIARIEGGMLKRAVDPLPEWLEQALPNDLRR